MTVDIRLGEWASVLADVPDASVRLLLTSPPYDNARTYEGTVGDDDAVDFDALATFAIRVLVPGGTLAMVLDGAVNDGVLSVTPFRVICEWAARPEWFPSQVLAYGRTGQPGAYAGRFRRDHEPLIVFRKPGPVVCNKDAVATRAAYRSIASDYGHATRRDGAKQRVTANREIRDIKHRGSIWDYGMVGSGQDPSSSTGHPATFAERFALDAVAVWSNPGDLVCDPFSGSGTVAVACVGLGRRFVGAERVPKYHAASIERVARKQAQPALFPPRPTEAA